MSDQLNYSRKKPGKVYVFLQDSDGYILRTKCDIEADAANITNCFNKLGFKVEEPLRNYTMKQIKSYLTKAYRSPDLSKYECILVFFVTHSPAVGQFRFNDGKFSAEKISKIFTDECRYPDLHKILIFQAPRSTAIRDSQAIQNDAAPLVLPPPGANFFIIKSSFELASPNESGSFFIKVLCQYMANIGPKTSLFDVITAVLGVLKAHRNKFPEERGNNPLPEVASTLLKPFYLNGNIPLDLPCYEHKESMGKLVVFNYNYNSDKSMNANRELREGTQFDVARMKGSFDSIGFKVEINHDLPADDVRRTLKKGSMCRESSCKFKKCGLRHKGDAPADYTKDTCAAIAVLSHGCENHFRTIDESMNVTHALGRLIMKKKENEERSDLSGKPKLLFQQVCRLEGEHCVQPLQFDDAIIFHSCFPGYISNRSPTEGTWFIQELCKIIDRIPYGESVSMTDLLQEMQQRFVEEHGNKQMPVIYSTLTKKLIVTKAPRKIISRL